MCIQILSFFVYTWFYSFTNKYHPHPSPNHHFNWLGKWPPPALHILLLLLLLLLGTTLYRKKVGVFIQSGVVFTVLVKLGVGATCPDNKMTIADSTPTTPTPTFIIIVRVSGVNLHFYNIASTPTPPRFPASFHSKSVGKSYGYVTLKVGKSMLLHARRLFQNAGLTNNAILSRKQMKFDPVIACFVWSNIFSATTP